MDDGLLKGLDSISDALVQIGGNIDLIEAGKCADHRHAWKNVPLQRLEKRSFTLIALF